MSRVAQNRLIEDFQSDDIGPSDQYELSQFYNAKTDYLEFQKKNKTESYFIWKKETCYSQKETDVSMSFSVADHVKSKKNFLFKI